MAIRPQSQYDPDGLRISIHIWDSYGRRLNAHLADSIAFRSHATVAANWPTGDGLRSFRRPPRERQLKPRID
jgi:hypothetical protein